MMGLPGRISKLRARFWPSIREKIAFVGRVFWETLRLFATNSAFRFVFSLMIGIAISGAVVIMLLEQHGDGLSITNIPDAIWWAFVTMTTVGYGDYAPVTPLGRIVAVLMMFAGLALTSLFTATVASIFVTKRLKEARGLERIQWHGHTLICGWNNHAEQVLISLIRSGHERIVLLNELDENVMAPILETYGSRVKYVKGNYCHEAALERANVRASESAIVLADQVSGTTANADERTILATLAIKTIEPHVVTCAELLDRDNEQHLRRADVDDIIVSGEASGLLLASSIASRGVPQVVRELLSTDLGNSFHRVDFPNQFVGRTFRSASDYFQTEHGAILVAIVSEESGIEVDDILGRDNSAIDEFIRRKFSEADQEVLGSTKQKVITIVNPGDDYQIQPQDRAIVIARKPIIL